MYWFPTTLSTDLAIRERNPISELQKELQTEVAMSVINPRIAERIRGPAWSQVRETFLELCDQVLAVGPSTRADLTTIYVKFIITDNTTAPVYAVAWLKTARNVVIGFALPDTINDELLTAAPTGMTYKGITKYFRLEPDRPLPPTITEWARIAFDEVTAQET